MGRGFLFVRLCRVLIQVLIYPKARCRLIPAFRDKVITIIRVQKQNSGERRRIFSSEIGRRSEHDKGSKLKLDTAVHVNLTNGQVEGSVAIGITQLAADFV